MLKADSSGKLVAAVAGTDFVAPAGLSAYVPTTRTITINGTSYDLSADRSWSIVSGVSSFNTRTGAITLADTDVTGALGYTPVTNARTLTINGTTYDLSANRSWSIVAGLSSFNTRTGAITLLDTDVTGALGYTPVTNARTITINGTTYDLSANRTWTVDASSVTTRVIQKFTATASQTTFTITGGYTVGMVDVFLNGVKLDNATEFTASNGSTVVLTAAAAVNDVVEVYKYGGQFIANNSLRQTTAFTATAGQTTFTVSYSVGFVDVFYNGSKLAASEFTATNGTSIVLGTACVVNDIVEVVAYNYTVGAFTGVGGSGTTNYISKWTASGTLGNSIIRDSGTVGINMAPDANTFSVTGTDNNWGLSVFSGTTTGQSYGAVVRGGTNANDVAFRVNNAINSTTYFTVNGNGYVGIGTGGPTSLLHLSSSGLAEIRIIGYGYGTSYNTTLRSANGSTGILQFGNNGVNYIMAGNTNVGGYLSFRVNCTAENTTSGTEAMRINYTTNVEKYISATGDYAEMQHAIIATGGNTTATTTTNGATYKIHTFTSTGTFTVYGYGLVEILVVGGAGGGGWDVGGGGGAGGYVETSTFVKPGTYTITVGGGGAGNTSGGGGTAASGSQSTALGIIALGGGGGGNYTGGSGGSGANGGGGAGYTGGPYLGGSGTFRQGNKGGNGRGDLYGSNSTGGGGGGAAAPGNDGVSNFGGYTDGGPGVVSWISGSSVTYCKGGAGGGDNWTGHQHGADNSGNGGDGAGNPNTGKNGGSGIVIIRYKV
jgi:predicted heme/steroid binding protein